MTIDYFNKKRERERMPESQRPPIEFTREQEGGEFDSPGFQSPRQRMDADRRRREREKKGGTGQVK